MLHPVSAGEDSKEHGRTADEQDQQACDCARMEEGEDSKPAAAPSGDVDMEEDEDAAMQMALQMSLQQSEEGEAKPSGEGQFQDPAFVNELLGSMPGVDPNDPEIQEALRKAQEGKKDDKKKDDDKKE